MKKEILEKTCTQAMKRKTNKHDNLCVYNDFIKRELQKWLCIFPPPKTNDENLDRDRKMKQHYYICISIIEKENYLCVIRVLFFVVAANTLEGSFVKYIMYTYMLSSYKYFVLFFI